jgi:hypothetical protein
MKLRHLKTNIKRKNVLISLTVVLVVATVGYAIIGSRAAGPFATVDAKDTAVSGNATLLDDATAGGKVIAFGSTSTPPVSGDWPALPPAQICGNNTILGAGPTALPAGYVRVPAGNNNSFDFERANTKYWFESGVHTLGTDQYSQIIPGDNTVFEGAPGAIIDGQRKNDFAFTQHATNVVIRYLTIRNFVAPLDQGVVNHDAGAKWTVEYSTITLNDGAGLMAGSDNLYQYNCIKDNGQYGINSCCGGDSDATDIQNFTLQNNEITGNNTGDWEAKQEGCGCTGGVKFWINKNVTVKSNWVHNNRGVGLWLDNNNRGFVIEGNYFDNNDSQALFIEAGYDAQVHGNNFKNNAIVEGRYFRADNDPFPIAAIYISDDGAPSGYGLKNSPMHISNNNFENNWGGVAMWENADRYSGSTAHTHISGTIKINNLYDDTACDGPNDTIPASVGDKYKCRWSTENVIVENNIFKIDKNAIGTGCVGANFCGISGIFANVGSYPEFSGYTIPWRLTFQQGNVFRNNQYTGDWRFAGFQTTKPDGSRVTWQEWTAPAPAVPLNFTHDNRPTTFGQDQGSTKN